MIARAVSAEPLVHHAPERAPAAPLARLRLGIISDAHHYRDASGALCTLTPLARQFEQWAALFESVTVCAPLLPGIPPASHTPYRAANVSLLPVGRAGGRTLVAKVRLARQVPRWAKAIRELLANVDAVHIRCPNNISIVGLAILARSGVLRQALYTGSWRGYRREPLTYRWQRWLLAHRFDGPIAVYGSWPGQPVNVVPSFSPSLAMADWDAESERVSRRVDALRRATALQSPLRLLTVGTLDRNKNQGVIVRTLAELRALGIEATLDAAGDGPLRDEMIAIAARHAVADRLTLHGRVAHDRLRDLYRAADFVVQAPLAEGFGKVAVESMCHGVVPLLSDVDLGPQLVGGGSRGRCFSPRDASAIAVQVAELAGSPEMLADMIERGRLYARELTLERWRDHIAAMLVEHWGDRLAGRRG